jgi:hypothetical protein
MKEDLDQMFIFVCEILLKMYKYNFYEKYSLLNLNVY